MLAEWSQAPAQAQALGGAGGTGVFAGGAGGNADQNGFNGSFTPGGAAGVAPGGAGSPGTGMSTSSKTRVSSGSGGGGGADGSLEFPLGGNGGAGGKATTNDIDSFGGGGGGGGGGGVDITSIFSNSGTVSGGDGGNGGAGAAGYAASQAASGGGGGGGGFGVIAAPGLTITNNAGSLIAGADGGTGGAGSVGRTTSGSPGAAGLGGVGVTGSGITVINLGAITGGLSGDAVTRADAIDFTGGSNTLSLGPSQTMTGAISVATGASLTFDQTERYLGGTGNNGTVSNAVVGGGSVTVDAGINTLTLSGANTYTGSTTISSGTLSVTGSIASPGASGVIDIASGATLSVGGSGGISIALAPISNAGTLNNNGLIAAGELNNTGTVTNYGVLGVVPPSNGQPFKLDIHDFLQGLPTTPLGTLNNAGTVTNSGTFGAVVASNSGIITNNGVWYGTANNTGGTINNYSMWYAGTGNPLGAFSPGSIINSGTFATGGLGTVYGNFLNNGKLDLTNCTVATMSVINGNYVGGSGSVIDLNVSGTGGNTGQANQLIITGKASGASFISVIPFNGAPAVFLNPIPIIMTGPGSNASFTLAPGPPSLFNYSLHSSAQPRPTPQSTLLPPRWAPRFPRSSTALILRSNR